MNRGTKHSWGSRIAAGGLFALGIALGYQFDWRSIGGESMSTRHSNEPPSTVASPILNSSQVSTIPGNETFPLRIVQSKSSRIWSQISNPRAAFTERELWLPKTVVQTFHWDVGEIGEHFKLSESASEVLDLTDDQKVSVESAVDKYLTSLRTIERSRAQITERSPTHVEIWIPDGIDVSAQSTEFHADMREILGASGAEMFLPAVESIISEVTPLLRNDSWTIELQIAEGDNVDVSTIMNNGSRRDFGPKFPEYLNHLVKIGEEAIK